jgi:hypothetical protein
MPEGPGRAPPSSLIAIPIVSQDTQCYATTRVGSAGKACPMRLCAFVRIFIVDSFHCHSSPLLPIAPF